MTGVQTCALPIYFDERIDQKIFHAEIVVDNKRVAAETKAYKPLPVITDFKDPTPERKGMKAAIQANYDRIKREVIEIVEKEKQRIAADPALRHLLHLK